MIPPDLCSDQVFVLIYEQLFKYIDNSPPIANNSEKDISRESNLYNILLSPNCIKCFDMHHILDVNCIDHLYQLEKIL